MKRALVVLLLCLAVAAVAVERWVTRTSRAGWRKVHAQMAADARSGGLQGLLRARVAGARVLAAEPGAADVLADLAFISAALAHHYGLASEEEAQALLARRAPLVAGRRAPPGEAAAEAARALLALQRGDRAAAEKHALDGADRDRADVRPLLALARTRVLRGEMVAASKALEAAIVKAPGAAAPLVQWAEVRLDLGLPGAPLAALRQVVAAAPEHGRAQLLLAEAWLGLGDRAHVQAAAASSSPLTAACRRDGALSPVVAAGCALHEAVALRLANQRAAAVARLEWAITPELAEPRTLALLALALAQLGRVDRADELLARATRQADPRLPPLAWARLAVALGRGQAAPWPRAVRPGHPETRLLAARAVLASEGQRALARFLGELGPRALAEDPDLRALGSLAPEHQAAAAATSAEQASAARGSPVQAYVEGLTARLAGDNPGAARALSRALADHGDACRAAGEWLVVTRLIGQSPAGELDHLRARNRDCLNLTLPPPPPRPAARRR
jgi:tetratricopeptide (TPR) repeat protein